MVSGFTKFKERFQGFENQYVIIGGTACDLIMENEELPFRATKDVDIVLIVESITAEFGRQFWEYVKEAGYEHLNKSTGNAQFYRFTSPKSKEYPYMIEIFSRNPDFIILEDDAVLTPLPIDDEISSLSAILLNEAFIGRALINEPAYILADEPTGNLDSKTSREILDILKFTNQKYKQTILLVTHDEKIALKANRIITIGDGKIIKDEVMK